jgi:hypothetical protein
VVAAFIGGDCKTRLVIQLLAGKQLPLLLLSFMVYDLVTLYPTFNLIYLVYFDDDITTQSMPFDANVK